MSLYHHLFGEEVAFKRGHLLLSALGFKRYTDVGRFRDAWVEKGNDGQPVIVIYTRNGGGNRACEDDGCEGDCTGCITTKRLPAHPLYIRDEDTAFDSTYAAFYFNAPEILRDDLLEIAQDPVDMNQVWKDAMKALEHLP